MILLYIYIYVYPCTGNNVDWSIRVKIGSFKAFHSPFASVQWILAFVVVNVSPNDYVNAILVENLLQTVADLGKTNIKKYIFCLLINLVKD